MQAQAHSLAAQQGQRGLAAGGPVAGILGVRFEVEVEQGAVQRLCVCRQVLAGAEAGEQFGVQGHADGPILVQHTER
ncbi:hypothetical protein D3C79_928730 [compost metagenome]